MKEIVILSGKGGTGKTTLTGSFASLASRKMNLTLADLDVDASNLELLTDPEVNEKHEFRSGKLATIYPELCTQCGICLEVCRFDAVKKVHGNYLIDESMCEGCLACLYQCPSHAINTKEQLSGEWFRSETAYGELFHARLKPGAENSGKLVSEVRTAAGDQCRASGCDILMMDGPPGTGCPVTASIRGVDLAVIVTEPTKSGLHDMERIQEVAQHFKVPTILVINKADLNLQVREEILDFAHKRMIPIAGEIPYDERIFTLQAAARPLIEVDDSTATDAIRMVWQRIQFKLET